MTNSALLEQILDSPQLAEYSEIIVRRLRDERERRQRFYEEMTDDQKTEFINGEVILHSPAVNRHLRASGNLFGLLHNWVRRTKCGTVFVEKALCCFTRNDYEPDITFFGPGKSAQFRDDTLKFPVPDFIVEILSYSTERYDRGVKFKDFAAHGVREYWIINPDDETLEQYLLNDAGEYSLKLKSQSGDVTSPVLAGLTIPIRAIFDPDVNDDTLAKLLR